MKLKKYLYALAATALLIPSSVCALTNDEIFAKEFPTGTLEIKSIKPPFYTGTETLIYSEFDKLGLYNKYNGVEIMNTGIYGQDEPCDGDECINVNITSSEGVNNYKLAIKYVGVDEELLKQLTPYFNKFKGTSEVDERNLFVIEDLEIINYMLVGGYSATQDSRTTRNAAINYSTEFKNLLDNKNISAKLEVRAGWDEHFTHGVFGDLLFMYEDTIYGMIDKGGVRGSHIIYIPSETTKDADSFINAAMTRIEKYIGEGKVTIEPGKRIDSLDEEYFNFPTADIVDLSKTLDIYFDFTINGETHKFLIVADSDKMQSNPKVETNDIKTNITIETEAYEVPLDSKIQSNKIKDGSKEEKEILDKLNKKDAEVYEIELYTELLDKYITKLSDGTFLVRVPIDKTYEGKEVIAYYIDKDGVVEEHPVTIKNGYGEFVTNHFSTYTLALKNEEVSNETPTLPEVPETKDNVIIYLATLIISASGIIMLKKTQKN